MVCTLSVLQPICVRFYVSLQTTQFFADFERRGRP
jgi:hypothetical protein